MKFRSILIVILVFSSFLTFEIQAQRKFSSVSSAPGSFTRAGFGARGIGMGNAISAVKQGNLVAYYNPAAAVFQEDNSFTTAYTFLGLDRSLNFLNFTRKFDFYSVLDTTENRKPRSTAGISVGIINAGVSNIDARDNQGFKRDALSTSENQIFLSLSNRFSDKLSVGLSAKMYYYKLYEEITATGLGFDLGVMYSYNDDLSFSFVIVDINSKYKWDTAPLYSTAGGTTTDYFPLQKKIGAAYNFRNNSLIVAAEFVFDDFGTQIIRAGAEWNLYENLYIRGGIDNFYLSNGDEPIRPSLGLSYSRELGGILAGFDYAFQIEPFSTGNKHVAGINIIF